MALPDDVDISCQYQRTTATGLECRIADTRSRYATDSPTPEICAECQIGRINRELGCKHIGGDVKLVQVVGGTTGRVYGLWCQLRKRDASYESCKQCSLIESENSVQTVVQTLDILDSSGMQGPRKSLTEARRQLQDMDWDGCIRSATVALESTLKCILDRLDAQYPARETVTDLWKTTKGKLAVSSKEDSLLQSVAGSLEGTVMNLAGVRNALSDAHGRGEISPVLCQSYAELALNTAAALVTFIVRRAKEAGRI